MKYGAAGDPAPQRSTGPHLAVPCESMSDSQGFGNEETGERTRASSAGGPPQTPEKRVTHIRTRI